MWFELYNEPAYDLGQGNTSIPILINGGKVANVPYKNGCPASPLTSFEFVGMQDILTKTPRKREKARAYKLYAVYVYVYEYVHDCIRKEV